MDFIQEDFDAKFHEFRAVARLTGIYSGDDISELFATFTQGQNSGSAAITYLRSDKGPKAFRLSAAQMDAFCTGWQTFKQRITEANEAEAQRRAAVYNQARELVKGVATAVDGLRVVVRKPDPAAEAFEVSVPAISWHLDGYAFGPDRLLEVVNRAIEVTEGHMAWLEENILPGSEGDTTSATLRNRAMVAAWRAIKPRADAAETNESALPDLEPESEQDY